MSDILTYGGTGAAIGGAIGGPPGVIIGGLIGGTIGAIANLADGGDPTVKLEHAQAGADISTYETYLAQFPGYAQAKEQEYQAKQNQDLGDRLAAMGMRGIRATGATGEPTSAAVVYQEQKSLFDTGYQQLVQSLNLEQTDAENKLKVAQATLDNTNTGGLFGHGGGKNPNPISDFLGLG